MKQEKLQPLQRRAIELLRQNPEMDIHAFSKLLGKNYSHAASLMSYARKKLGQPVRERPTKVDKTMALIQLGINVKGHPFREQLQVKACRASELRHLAKKRLDNGQRPTEDAIAWALSTQDKGPAKPDDTKHDLKPSSKKSIPSVTAKATATGQMSVNSVQRIPKNPRELIEEAGLSPDEWFVANQIVNRWEIGAKHPDTGEILVEPLFQTKVRLEPIGATEGLAEALKEYITQLKEAAPILPQIEHSIIEDGHLAEISIPDLHVGKYASANETGESYNLEIACTIFRNALHDLVSQCITAYPIEKILFPVGNDFLNGDNLSNSTTRGTPQDSAGNLKEHFRCGMNLLREAIETLRAVAPVDVIIVPGNHDAVASFALGQLLGALYDGSQGVTVHDSSDQPRKYITFGNILLGFAHGHNEKARDLPMLMAMEAAEMWGKTRHREFHVGHLHHTRDTHFMGTNEKDGVIHRVIPSLSSADRWHADKGYRSQRAALAFVYHRSKGQRAIFRYSILDRLQITVENVA